MCQIQLVKTVLSLMRYLRDQLVIQWESFILDAGLYPAKNITVSKVHKSQFVCISNKTLLIILLDIGMMSWRFNSTFLA